jgi:phosphatidylinositol alpha 1,6-mannosyltransferase
LSAYRRVAFLPDTFHEINGVANTSRHLEQFVRRRQIPFLSIRPGLKDDITSDGCVRILNLKRSALSFALDTNLDCDPLMLRHARLVLREARAIGVELVQITGPGDMGMLGCYLAWRLRVPMVMGWHTNLHQYAASRMQRLFKFAPTQISQAVASFSKKSVLWFLRKFYRQARLVLAPNQELAAWVNRLTGTPAYVMQRGVDTRLFTPARRDRHDARFRIGYVGRLTPEKNVQLLAELAKALLGNARREFEFYIVGQGSEREWLASHLPSATFAGVLAGEELARAYANFDLFVFPSTTDTFGNVVLEALASGVPCVVTSEGGPKFLVQTGVTGCVARDSADFVRCVLGLLHDLETLHRMRESARHYACGLSWDGVFERVFRHYETALSGAPSGKMMHRGLSQPIAGSRSRG